MNSDADPAVRMRASPGMTSATGVRIGWHDLPDHVRAHVEDILGSAVVEARSQRGGFSPGTADRVRVANGQRAFIKAVSAAQNERTPEMHRQEARVTAALPSDAPAPNLLGCHDDGEWVALVLEDVDGRQPVTPWQRAELDSVLATLRCLAYTSMSARTTCCSAPMARSQSSTGRGRAAALPGWTRCCSRSTSASTVDTTRTRCSGRTP